MPSFRLKFQISGVTSLKENGYKSQLFRGSILSQTLLKENIRHLRLWKLTNQPVNQPVSQTTKSLDQPSAFGNCGKPLPPCMNLICKGCPSKCLEPKIQKNKKSVSKKKSKADLLEEKLTWWEKIFGPSPERFWPDPCTCRLVHREKKKIRMNDSRLCDPRYQMTAGDVFLYTEMTKQHRQPCLEPQPKPPPVYKIPKSALIRLINNLCDQPPITRIGIIPRSAKCKHSTELVEYRTPYAEMRPPQSTEKQLVCYKGILPQDVFPTTSGWKNLYQDSQKQPKKQYDLTKDFEHYEAEKCEMFKKHSRVEQLKMLVRKKNMCQCSKSW